MRITPLALAAALLLAGGGPPARAADGRSKASPTPPNRDAAPLAVGGTTGALPIELKAQQIQGRPDLDAVAEGAVELRQGGLLIRADRLAYQQAEDRATATGNVSIRRDGMVYSGTELQLQLQRFEGFFLQPVFEFERLGTGGRADRVDFIDRARSRAVNASYTSCPRDGSGDPDWVLQTRRVSLDFNANEGIAEGAVLRFLGLPILALPVLSFPITDARKSGWLPPRVSLDSRSGFELQVPYYWNIAPNRDATIAPRVITRRGLGLEGEFRYLEPRYEGVIGLDLLPHDRIAGRSRHALQWTQDARLPYGLQFRADWARVSDDDWWKDFPKAGRGLTPRLLGQRVGAERAFALADGEGLAYVRVHHWQVLQNAEQPIVSPYQRSPQLGVRASTRLAAGFEAGVETELNRFTLPGHSGDDSRLTGQRWHLHASLSRPWRPPGGWLVPKLSLRAVDYALDQPLADGRRSASRVVPTLSVDAGFEFERETEGFGRVLRQTLEPRLLYVNTPYREQSGLPNFDAAGLDFNFASVFSENAFSGVDRVSDAHQVTFGATSRLFDAASGAEALRLGLVQRYLLRTQRVTPRADGTPDGAPLTQRFSDLLLLGSTSVLPGWTLDAAVQYSPDFGRAARSVVGARYSPGPFRTVSTTYRLARGLSEQLELGWQWPIGRAAPTPAALAAASGIGAAAGRNASSCSGTWYTVGRVNYSLKDSRITDSVLGFEYDAGCWIGRVVAERLSTGRSEATTRLLLQLELVGLSRLGSNPLQVLKDNIPGYRLLRDERQPSPETPAYD